MTKPGDSQTKKTLHELAKEFPDKSYRQLEIYRDADRKEEAQRIFVQQENEELKEDQLTESQKSQDKLEPIGMGHNQPPDEREEQDNPTLWELANKHNINYADAVPIQEDMRLKRDALKAACTIGEMKKDRTPLTKMKKRAQEAEGELSIMKGIETNRVKEAQARSSQLQDELDRTKKENNDLHNKVADLTEAIKSKDYFEKPDYKFLVNENHRLEQQYLEAMADNKKLAKQIEDKLDQLRKSGL